MLKSLIIFAVILLIQRNHAEIEIDLFDKCSAERAAQLSVSNNCKAGLDNIDEIITEMQRVLSQVGDENTNQIKLYSNKICTFFDRSLTCTASISDFNEPCLSHYHVMVASERTNLNVSRAILNYVCQNEGQIFLDIAQNDVEDVLKDIIRTCEFRKQSFEEPNASSFRINPAFCQSVEDVFMCYADLVKNHQNQHLRRIVRELHDIIKSELQC